MVRRTVSRCALKLESLEEKTMLAGDVMVGIINGEVYVRGDQEANHVLVEADVAENRLVIRGLPDANGVDTTLNGQNGPVTIEGLGRDVDIRTGQGDDVVDIPAGRFQNLAVGTGRGDDVVRIGVTPNSTGAAGVNVLGDLNVHLASGADRLVAADSNIAGRAFFGGGSGADRMLLANVMTSDAHIRGGRGADQIDVLGSSIGNLWLNSGAGNDEVRLIDSAFSDLRVGLGAGNDALTVGSNSVTNTAVVFGGDGFDRLSRVGPNQTNQIAILSFEAIGNGIDGSEATEDVPRGAFA
jgi:hypothetical protein